jgi:hypothetical protein
MEDNIMENLKFENLSGKGLLTLMGCSLIASKIAVLFVNGILDMLF